MENKNYVPNGSIKEFNEAVENHWQFYINTCYDPQQFLKTFPVAFMDLFQDFKIFLSCRDLIQLYQMASLPDKTLIDFFQYNPKIPFNLYRIRFAEYINNEGKYEK